ncbi:MAG: lipoate--protein ligase family protein [Clostridiaceae bacterium]|nr:lipoate--protein ligase family protein [Clostridiaceae bacterium]
MKFVPYKVYTGKENMQIDSDILENAIKNNSKEPVFRLYGWSPACVSLGRNQKDNFIDYKFLKSKNIDVVRRLTGGRALLHDNELTYSFVCPFEALKNGDNVTESYKEISQILIDKLANLGIELSFGGSSGVHTKFDYCMLISTGADLTYCGKKLIGSAQFRKDGYILQHGSILYDYNRTLLEEIFKEEVDTSSITSIREINPSITFEDVVNTLIL